MTLVIGNRVDSISYESATSMVAGWSYRLESRYICAANVHMLMEAYDTSNFRKIVNNADLVTPDGMPLVWMMRLKGERNQSRVYGPTLMLHILETAARENIPVGFYGGQPAVLKSLIKQMQTRFAGLDVAYSFSPPFHALSPEEDLAMIEQVNASGAHILFVGLGCPKQEYWMANHRGRVHAVMMGVGAAFDFHSGMKPQAPVWIQAMGLEWLFRFINEPRRLWRRYLFHNPRFIVLAIADLLGLIRE